MKQQNRPIVPTVDDRVSAGVLYLSQFGNGYPLNPDIQLSREIRSDYEVYKEALAKAVDLIGPKSPNPDHKQFTVLNDVSMTLDVHHKKQPGTTILDVQNPKWKEKPYASPRTQRLIGCGVIVLSVILFSLLLNLLIHSK